MVEVTKNPSETVSNTGAWTNTVNSWVKDDVCAYKFQFTPGVRSFVVSKFGFDIPADAVIDEVYVGFHAKLCHYTGTPYLAALTVTLAKGVNAGEAGAAEQEGLGSCLVCVDAESVNLQGLLGLTVNDLNTDDFTVTVTLRVVEATWYGLVDEIWIRVVYHLPAPPPAKPLISKPLINRVLTNAPCVR